MNHPSVFSGSSCTHGWLGEECGEWRKAGRGPLSATHHTPHRASRAEGASAGNVRIGKVREDS